MDRVTKNNDEWKKELTAEEYRVMREKGTETPFSGKYWNEHAVGMYRCRACGLELFSSDAKFDSGTGWPSFYKPVADDQVATASDTSHGMQRTEVQCPRCGAH